jgi:glycosyltransferase involved in cell wall biosynthesis
MTTSSYPFLNTPVPITEQKWPKGTMPLVSIFSWSYNHANFIRESIESILVQKTTFSVEIIIHDDASTDGTVEIIREYESKYPQLFRNILQSDNQWSQGKSVMDALFFAPRGNFIALTHGDDFWIYEYKLLTQVKFLTQNQIFSGVFHRGVAVNNYSKKIPFNWDKIDYKDIYTQKDCIFDLLSGYPTAALVFRKKVLNKKNSLPTYFIENPCDYTLDILISEHGNLAFLDFEGSAYRQHSGGTWSVLNYTQMHKHMVDRFAALWRCKNIVEKYTNLKSKLLRLMDVQWWLYFESENQTWASATLKILSEQRRCGMLLCLQWLLRPESPARFKLRDWIFGYHKE